MDTQGPEALSLTTGEHAGTWGWGAVDPAGALMEEHSVLGSPSLCAQKPEDWGLNTKAHKRLCISSFNCAPLPASPLLPPPTTGEDDDGEENCSCKCSQDDNDDWHGVSWRRYRGHGRDTRNLTRARWLWLYHWKMHKVSVLKASINCNLQREKNAFILISYPFI